MTHKSNLFRDEALRARNELDIISSISRTDIILTSWRSSLVNLMLALCILGALLLPMPVSTTIYGTVVGGRTVTVPNDGAIKIIQEITNLTTNETTAKIWQGLLRPKSDEETHLDASKSIMIVEIEDSNILKNLSPGIKIFVTDAIDYSRRMIARPLYRTEYKIYSNTLDIRNKNINRIVLMTENFSHNGDSSNANIFGNGSSVKMTYEIESKHLYKYVFPSLSR
ncbi:hypothetical protein PUR29_35265 [Methylobacterium ajmalii]|uniref:Bacterial virulence protein VirB8 domain-containing protein n=1 Tax=Methylobacterium ajmalii TaxID=2738439 RepID=A0ABV0A6M3_9HYPH|nr:hypothetical protein [uncultured Methylobacterium sp.]